MKDYNHFVVLAAGDNPRELMERYDLNKKVEPYVKYKFSDAGNLRRNYLSIVRGMLSSGNASKEETDELKETIEDIENMDDIQFFLDFTSEYDYDDETGDAITDRNPEGKWTSCTVGKIFSVPFITISGKETFSDIKGNIDWNMMHLHGTEIYDATWDVVMGGKLPETDVEKQVYENMRNRTAYFEKFGTKEKYVASNTAFWCYAYVDKNGWVEIGDDEDQFEWMTKFYDRFVVPLPENTLLTLFECRRN